VVVSTVVLLISILLPALANARKSARGAACLSNLHQIGIAQTAYAAENNYFTVSRTDELGYKRFWDYKLMDYLIEDGTAVTRDAYFEFIRDRGLRCPDAVVRGDGSRFRSYAQNAFRQLCRPGFGYDPKGVKMVTPSDPERPYSTTQWWTRPDSTFKGVSIHKVFFVADIGSNKAHDTTTGWTATSLINLSQWSSDEFVHADFRHAGDTKSVLLMDMHAEQIARNANTHAHLYLRE